MRSVDGILAQFEQDPPPDYIPLAVIGRAHGLGGAFALRPLVDSPLEILADAQVVWIRSEEGPSYRVPVRAFAPKALRMELDGVTDRESARALVHLEVGLSRQEFPELDQDVWYVADLQGCAVLDAQGKEVGEIETVEENPAHQVLSVRSPQGKLLSIPFVEAHVAEVDLPGRVVRLTQRPYVPEPT